MEVSHTPVDNPTRCDVWATLEALPQRVGSLLNATAVPKMPVDGRCEDVIFFDGVFFEPSLTSIFFAP